MVYSSVYVDQKLIYIWKNTLYVFCLCLYIWMWNLFIYGAHFVCLIFYFCQNLCIYELYNLIFVFPFCSYYFIDVFFCNLEDFVIWDCLSQQLSFDKKPMPKFSINDAHSQKSCIPKLHYHFDNIIIIQVTSSKMVCAGFMNNLMWSTLLKYPWLSNNLITLLALLRVEMSRAAYSYFIICVVLLINLWHLLIYKQ